MTDPGEDVDVDLSLPEIMDAFDQARSCFQSLRMSDHISDGQAAMLIGLIEAATVTVIEAYADEGADHPRPN